jgi:hypothetical protein
VPKVVGNAVYTCLWHHAIRGGGYSAGSLAKMFPRFWRHRRRWEDNIKMDLTEVECRGMDWMELAQERDRWRVFVSGNEPSGFVKCGEFLD